MRAIALLLLPLAACLELTDPSALEPWMREWFERAQFSAGAWGGHVFAAYPERFRYERMPDDFVCVYPKVTGFDLGSKTIRYTTPRSFGHAAAHAILWFAKCSCWREFEHAAIRACECE